LCHVAAITAKKQSGKFEKIVPEKEARGHDFQIHVSVSDLQIPTIDLPILLQANM
jgi:hypothetical protein